MLTRVILVRHGQTLWNHTKKYQGHSDIPLNETGLMQVRLVAKRLSGETIGAVYSSDSLRATQTAKIIAQPHRIPIVPLPGLREINFGVWEGRTYEEIMADWPDLLTAMYSHPGDSSAPGGESFNELKQRVLVAFGSCIVDHKDETIVIVAHGGTLRILLCDALGIGLDRMWSIRQDSTAISMIEYYDSQAVVALVNDTCHMCNKL